MGLSTPEYELEQIPWEPTTLELPDYPYPESFDHHPGRNGPGLDHGFQRSQHNAGKAHEGSALFTGWYRGD